MAYTVKDFKTKKELKEAVAKWNEFLDNLKAGRDAPRCDGVMCYQPNAGLTGAKLPMDGTVTLEGPHYPKPHTWYAQATLKDGVVVKVK